MSRAVIILLILLLGCGPIKKPSRPHFYVIVVNDDDPAFSDHIAIGWWFGTSLAGSVDYGKVPGGTSISCDMGETWPDGFEIDTTAGNFSFGSPEYNDCWVFEFHYPHKQIIKKYGISHP